MIKFILGFIAACIIWLIILIKVEIPEYKVFDCRMSEFHPDFPPDVREECRRQRNEQLKRQRYENSI
jgi:hypothetical protein